MLDESARDDALEELPDLVQQAYWPLGGRLLRRLPLRVDEDQIGPLPRGGEGARPEACVVETPQTGTQRAQDQGLYPTGDTVRPGAFVAPEPFDGLGELFLGDLEFILPGGRIFRWGNSDLPLAEEFIDHFPQEFGVQSFRKRGRRGS